MEPNRVVVRYADRRLIKGYTHNFSPARSTFHLSPGSPVTANSSGKIIEVQVKDLKAVFFVRDFAGKPGYEERKEFAREDQPPGRKLEVTFADGEVLVGYTVAYDSRRPGFFLVPVDPQSNNLKVFVVSHAVTKIRYF